MVNWQSSDIQEWREKAKEEQEYYCEALGDRDYDEYKPDEIKYLDLKIGCAYYGPPKNVDENQNEVELSNYNCDQQDHIRKTRNLILSKTQGENIRVAFIFLSVKQHSQTYQVPIIRFLDWMYDDAYFIDHQMRLYNGWEKFLKENLFPKCIYCYPVNGEYKRDKKDLILCVNKSPRCKFVQKVASVADTTSTVATLGSVGVAIGSIFFPPVAALIPAVTMAGVGSGAYSVARNASRLEDRLKHKQSIDPFKDAEARGCWLACVGGAFNMGSMGLLRYTTHLARNGDIASKALRVAYSCFEGGNLTVNGLGIVAQIHELSNKKEKVSILDIVGLSTSILFFTHSCLNLKRASTIIKEVQDSVMTDYKASMSSAKNRENFQKLVDDSIGEKKMHGNARVIKSLKLIDNVEDFVKNTSAIKKKAGGNHDFKLTDDGTISINGQLDVHPDKMVKMSKTSRKEVLECTKKLEAHPDYASQFQSDMRDICKQERIKFEVARKETVSKIRSSLGIDNLSDFKLNGKPMFKEAQPHEIDRFGYTMNTSGQNYDTDLLEICNEFASKNNCLNISDFCSYMDFIHQYVSNGTGNCSRVSQKYKEFLSQLRDPQSEKMTEMVRQFTDLKKEVSAFNSCASYPFASDNQAASHFYKHKDFQGKELTLKEYFGLIKSTSDNPNLPRTSTLTQDGRQVRTTIIDPNSGVKVVLSKPNCSSNDGRAHTITCFWDARSCGPSQPSFE